MAQSVPLPRPRPGVQPAARPEPPVASAPSACRVRLTERLAIAPSIDPIAGPGGCGGEDMVRLEAVILPDASRVQINPPAVLRCPMAEAIAEWVRGDLTALAASSFGSAVRVVRNFAAYHCRPRNNIFGALMSEHGLGNALDIRSITLVNGRTVEPTDAKVPREFREGWKQSVCGRFSTVLGPGSDGYHENHIHVDLMQRRKGYRALCRWDVHGPEAAPAPALDLAAAGAVPLPPRRPKMKPAPRRK